MEPGEDAQAPICSVWESLGGFDCRRVSQKNLLASGAKEMETLEEKHRSALEPANKAGEHPGGAFCGQEIPLESCD